MCNVEWQKTLIPLIQKGFLYSPLYNVRNAVIHIYKLIKMFNQSDTTTTRKQFQFLFLFIILQFFSVKDSTFRTKIVCSVKIFIELVIHLIFLHFFLSNFFNRSTNTTFVINFSMLS